MYLVGGGASLLVRQPVGVDGEAEAGSLDAVLGLGLVELAHPPLLLLLPLPPLLAPVASLLGALRAQLRRPRRRLRGGARSAAVLPALRGRRCRGNLPANGSKNTVVMATSSACVSEALVEKRSWQLRAAAA